VLQVDPGALDLRSGLPWVHPGALVTAAGIPTLESGAPIQGRDEHRVGSGGPDPGRPVPEPLSGSCVTVHQLVRLEGRSLGSGAGSNR
jgi:hypothetical protein